MWSLVSSEALIMIQSKLPMVPIRESDRTICITSKTGDFSCAKGWVQIPFKASGKLVEDGLDFQNNTKACV